MDLSLIKELVFIISSFSRVPLKVVKIGPSNNKFFFIYGAIFSACRIQSSIAGARTCGATRNDTSLNIKT